jgi:hypothetical protein
MFDYVLRHARAENTSDEIQVTHIIQWRHRELNLRTWPYDVVGYNRCAIRDIFKKILI